MASYAATAERLRVAVGIEPSVRALGIDEVALISALPYLVLNTYEDHCAPTGPRMPTLDEREEIMRAAHYSGPRPLPLE